LQTAAAYAKSPATAITNVTGAGVPVTINTLSVANVAVGDVAVISGVQGNTAANGVFTVASVDANANTFTLNGPNGTGAYTSGGTFTNATGQGTLEVRYQPDGRSPARGSVGAIFRGSIETNGATNILLT